MSSFRDLVASFALFGFALAFAACAQPIAAPMSSLRVLVRTQVEWNDLSNFGVRVSQISGLPVRDVSASSPQLLSVTLLCDRMASCDAGLLRLIDAHDFIAEASPEMRRKRLQPIPPAASGAH